MKRVGGLHDRVLERDNFLVVSVHDPSRLFVSAGGFYR